MSCEAGLPVKRFPDGGARMRVRITGEEYRVTTVCVDSYENGVLSGRFYNPYLQEGKEFRSMAQFLLGMEQTLDMMEFPKSYTAKRTFASAPGSLAGNVEEEIRQGRIATFQVRVLFRQNASWQGSVVWLEGKREESFRSALELFFLIDSALTGADAA